jgi:hypothetical protein
MATLNDLESVLKSINTSLADQSTILNSMLPVSIDSEETRKNAEQLSSVNRSSINNSNSSTGSTLSGAGDFLNGGGNFLAGAGTGALKGIGAALLGLVGLELVDAKKIKDNVLTLLSIPDSMGDKTKVEMLEEGGLVVLALYGLGKSLQTFAIGGAFNAAVDYFAGDWAKGVKDNVEILLSNKV